MPDQDFPNNTLRLSTPWHLCHNCSPFFTSRKDDNCQVHRGSWGSLKKFISIVMLCTFGLPRCMPKADFQGALCGPEKQSLGSSHAVCLSAPRSYCKNLFPRGCSVSPALFCPLYLNTLSTFKALLSLLSLGRYGSGPAPDHFPPSDSVML